jgi:putative addiction module killer protein
MFTIHRYQTPEGNAPIESWMASLRDIRAEARILARIARLESGNFGDWKHLGKGVCELRIDYGPGYRLYFSRIGEMIVLLLCGGDK